MKDIFRIFFYTRRSKAVIVLICLLLSNILGAIGIAALLPILAMASDPTLEKKTGTVEIFRSIFDFIGIAFTFESMIIFVITAIVLKSVIGHIAMRFVGKTVANIGTGLRSDLVSNLLRVKWAFYSNQPVGRYANAISVESERAATTYLTSAMVVSRLIEALAYAGIAFFVNWKVAIFAMALAAFMSWSLRSLVVRAKRAGRKQSQRTSELVSRLSDVLIGIKTLKAMDRYDHVQHFFNDTLDKLRKSLYKMVHDRELLRYIQEPILSICLIGGFYLAINKFSIPIESLLIMGLLMERTVTSFNRVQRLQQTATVTQPAYWNVINFIKQTKEKMEAHKGTKTPALDHSCRFEGVSFWYENNIVLDAIDLEIPADKITVLYGPSGVGKTTIADLLIGLRMPKKGNLTIDGTPIQDVDISKWRRMIGYVPQEHFLFYESIFDNIALGDESIGDEDVKQALIDANAWSFVSKLKDGMHSMPGERGGFLSGGQRQRIALARALVHKPKLLILDEATSALDEASERRICETIKVLAENVTVFAITHRPAWFEIADRIYNIDETGPHLINPEQRRLSIA